MESQTGVTSISTTSASSVSAREEALLQELARIEAGIEPEKVAAPVGDEHLLFWINDTPFVAPLNVLREALPVVPPHIALPFSPPWLWGIFPLRTELVALVDPWPTLTAGPLVAREAPSGPASLQSPHAEATKALIVGEGEQMLGLLVGRVGDICLLEPGDEREALAASPPIAARYIAGAYAVAGVDGAVFALDVAALTDDIFEALKERSAHE